MRILIMSDTHRDTRNALEAIRRSGKIDMCLHLGDVEFDAEVLKAHLDCPLYMVRGNNDFLRMFPEELELTIGKYKVFMAHGHRYLVGMGTERFIEEALSRDADIAIYGHTHKPIVWVTDEITLLCPGSISYPRQNKRKNTYIIMDIDEQGEAHYTVNYIE